MAHQIDMTNNRANIAYVGDAPWHRLGQKLNPGQPVSVWAKEAGLDYNVIRADVQYAGRDSCLVRMPERKVLFRDDTGDALSVVSKDYRVVQPAVVLDFFRQLSDVGGFELEVAGSLSGGRRIWGLARVNDGAPIIGQDTVRPYVLLATSYDATMATVAKFTAIRVVCNNTITMAVGGAEGLGKTESDTEGRAVSSMVRIPHSAEFKPEEARQRLGIVANAWERWLVETRMFAERELSAPQAENFAKKLLDAARGSSEKPIEQTKGYRKVMDLFSGGLIGADLAGGGNRWTMLNAVTEFVDHERGRSDSTRMTSAWFGSGEGLKTKAYKMLASDETFA